MINEHNVVIVMITATTTAKNFRISPRSLTVPVTPYFRISPRSLTVPVTPYSCNKSNASIAMNAILLALSLVDALVSIW